MRKFTHAVLGGTFDNLHKGHKFFIKSAFENSDKVTIGLTSQSYLQAKKGAENIFPYEERKKNLINFLTQENLINKVTIVEINDLFGITLQEKNIDAIFVTKDTISNAQKINKERERIHFPLLEIVTIEMIPDEMGKTISSTNIRRGTINDFGAYYISLFKKAKEYTLIDQCRNELKKPIGKIVENFTAHTLQDKFVIAVGDMVVYHLVSQGNIPNISIFDLISKRETIAEDIKKMLPVENILLPNRPGTINSYTALQLQEIIKDSYQKNIKKSIRIEGEEDLLTIPAILFAPLNSVVVYGLRDIGGIVVDVNLEIKKEIEDHYLPMFK